MLSQTLLNYFLAALALPESEVWVNLSPYEQNRIIPDKLGRTQMGKELLGQDYILKQLAASFFVALQALAERLRKDSAMGRAINCDFILAMMVRLRDKVPLPDDASYVRYFVLYSW